MRILLLLLCAVLLASSVQAQEKIVTCEVVEVNKSVACPEGGKMVKFEFTDPVDAKAIFDEWRKVAPTRDSGSVNGDAPLMTREIRVGDKVKAIINSEKFAVTECHVRVWDRLQERKGQGQIPPNILYTLPDDCQPWYTEKP